MSVYIPTILEFQDGLLFLELGEIFDEAGNSSSQLIWTNGSELLFSYEPIVRQLLFPQFSTYPKLKIVATEPMTRFRRSSAIAISDFVFWLQNVTDVTFNTSQSLINLYLESREINIQPSDYPLWLEKLQTQLSPSLISPESALTQLENLRFKRN